MRKKNNPYHSVCKLIILAILVLSPKLFFGQLIKSVSLPEYLWAIRHPFKTPKAFKITKLTIYLTDSIVKADSLPNPGDGKADALMHTLWMALLTNEFDSATAISLGVAHEKAGTRDHKKGSFVHDSISMEMDLHNNQIGVRYALRVDTFNQDFAIKSLLNMINNGYMLIIKRDAEGDFVDCNGNKLIWPPEQKLWNTQRCLCPSNE